MYGQTVLFLCIAILVECTMCIAGDSRPNQEKEGNYLARITQNNQVSRLETERETNQILAQFRRASKLAGASRDVPRSEDENKTYPTYLQRRATQLVDHSEKRKMSSVQNHLLEGVLERDRRNATYMTKSTPADISRLFEDKSGTSTGNTSVVEGGGEPLEILVTSTLRSPKQTSSTTSHPSSSSTTKSLPIEDSINASQDIMQINVTNEDPKSHKTVPRKGAEVAKIFGRKGVDEETSVNCTLSNMNSASTSTTSTNISSDLALADDLSLKEGMPLEMVSPSTTAPSLPSNNSSHDIIESNPPLKKKPKPLKLSDTTSFNTSPVPHDHVPSQRDIVLPVVGLILAVPMVTVLGIFLYKKGSEYWSRRHYRRMDFLIDGMYND